MEDFEFCPDKEERIDIYLSDKLGFTRSRVKNIIDNGDVLYNDTTTNYYYY